MNVQNAKYSKNRQAIYMNVRYMNAVQARLSSGGSHPVFHWNDLMWSLFGVCMITHIQNNILYILKKAKDGSRDIYTTESSNTMIF